MENCGVYLRVRPGKREGHPSQSEYRGGRDHEQNLRGDGQAERHWGIRVYNGTRKKKGLDQWKQRV